MKILILMIAMVLLVTPVMASTLDRGCTSSVNGGSTFIVTYNTVNAPIGKWFVAWDDTITGGCTPTNYKSFMVSETGGDSSITKTFTAPASGSCTFSGFYQYAYQSANETEKSFPNCSVSVVQNQTQSCSDITNEISCNSSNGCKWDTNKCVKKSYLTIIIIVIALFAVLLLFRRR